MAELTSEQIVEQSKNAIRQWGKQWVAHCKEQQEKLPQFMKQNLNDFRNSGVGKACLLIANGYSFEQELETIKKYQGNVDIMVCDKTLGHALDHGIIPTYAIVCDANVSYERYMEKWKDKLSNTILIQNVCANPKWSLNGNWKNKYFFIVKDAVQSENTYTPICECPNQIPAGTNVSNAMVVVLTQSDNTGRKVLFGYDKILLIGFDYSWMPNGNYYAFDHLGNGKFNYMRHIYGKNLAGQLCYTSNNLVFSAKWLDKYINAFNLPVIQCSKSGIFNTKTLGVLSEQMQYNYKKEDSFLVRELTSTKESLVRHLKEIDSKLISIGKDHYFNYLITS